MNATPKTIRDLLREHIDRTGDSYQDIATKTGLSKPLIGAIMANTKPRSYRPATVDKLAAGLRLPADVMHRAAAASAGMAVTLPDTPADRDDARFVVELLEHLDDPTLHTVRVIVQALVDDAR